MTDNSYIPPANYYRFVSYKPYKIITDNKFRKPQKEHKQQVKVKDKHVHDSSDKQKIKPLFYTNSMKVFKDEDIKHDKQAEEGEKECVMCIDNVPNCIIIPCFHNIICIKCSIDLCKNKKKGEVDCPKCRKIIKKIKRVYE